MPDRQEPPRRLRPAPLLFEPEELTAEPERFFQLESLDDPGELLRRSTELALAFRIAAERATDYQAIAAAQLADPHRFDSLSPPRSPPAPTGRPTTRSGWSSTAAACCASAGRSSSSRPIEWQPSHRRPTT